MVYALNTAPFALVVDDDAMILSHAADILEDASFRTLLAYNADQALERLEKHHDEVVLLFTDVEMPGRINGFALARIVAERWPDIGILLASGNINPAEGDMPEGAIFVEKPFAAEVVHDRVRKILPEDKKPEPLKGRPKPV